MVFKLQEAFLHIGVKAATLEKKETAMETTFTVFENSYFCR